MFAENTPISRTISALSSRRRQLWLNRDGPHHEPLQGYGSLPSNVFEKALICSSPSPRPGELITETVMAGSKPGSSPSAMLAPPSPDDSEFSIEFLEFGGLIARICSRASTESHETSQSATNTNAETAPSESGNTNETLNTKAPASPPIFSDATTESMPLRNHSRFSIRSLRSEPKKALAEVPKREATSLIIGARYEAQEPVKPDSLMEASQVSLLESSDPSFDTTYSGSFSLPSDSANGGSQQFFLPPGNDSPPPAPPIPSDTLHTRLQAVRQQLMEPTQLPEQAASAARSQENLQALGEPLAEKKFKPPAPHTERVRTVADNRMSTFSMASSIAALGPFISSNAGSDTMQIKESSPDIVEDDIKHFFPSIGGTDELPEECFSGPADSNGGQPALSKRLHAPKKLAKDLNLLSAAESPEIFTNVVKNLSNELDQRFNSLENEIRTATELDWHPKEVVKTEKRSRLKRILEWCRAHKSMLLRHDRPGHYHGSWRHPRAAAPQSQSVSGLPFEMHLDTPPMVDSPFLGDAGSPPMSLRAQTAPAGI